MIGWKGDGQIFSAFMCRFGLELSLHFGLKVSLWMLCLIALNAEQDKPAAVALYQHIR